MNPHSEDIYSEHVPYSDLTNEPSAPLATNPYSKDEDSGHVLSPDPIGPTTAQPNASTSQEPRDIKQMWSARRRSRKKSEITLTGIEDDVPQREGEYVNIKTRRGAPTAVSTAQVYLDGVIDGALEVGDVAYLGPFLSRTQALYGYDYDLIGPHILERALSQGSKWFIRDIVTNHLTLVARGPYAWLQSLREANLSSTQICEILCDLRYDSPWIDSDFQCDYKEPRENFHTRGCIHSVPDSIGKSGSNLPSSITLDTQTAIEKSRESESAHQASNESQLIESGMDIYSPMEKISMLCGIAGAIPKNKHAAEFQESQVSITFSTSSRDIVSELKEAGRRLLTAIAIAQDAAICCDSLIIPFDVPSPFPSAGGVTDERIVTFKTIRFYEIQQMIGVLELAVDNLARGLDRASPCPFEEATLCCYKLLENIYSSGINMSIGNHWHSRIVDLILSNRSNESRWRVMIPLEIMLDICSVTVQMCSLAFLYFVGGYVSGLEIPILTRPVASYLLCGNGYHEYMGRCKIIAESQKLTCVGQMLQDEVLVFRFVQDRDYTPYNMLPRHLYASISEIAELWGPIALVKTNSTTKNPDSLVAVEMRSGNITLTGDRHRGPKVRMAHWEPGGVDLLRNPKLSNSELYLDEKLLIGAIHLNRNCNINVESNFQRAMNNSLLISLNTCRSHWENLQRQAQLGLSFSVAGNFSYTQGRVRGVTKKEEVNMRWKEGKDWGILNEPWGLLVSLCTGIAKRVALRLVIAEVLLAHLDSVAVPSGTSHDIWSKQKKRLHQILLSNDCVEILQQDTDDLTFQKNAEYVVSYMLIILMDTGIDSTGSIFKVDWAHAGSSPLALQFDALGSYNWSKVLRDSQYCATFAAITSDCYETESNPCRSSSDQRSSVMDFKMISTGVLRYPHPQGISRAGPQDFELRHKELYLIGQPDTGVFLMMLRIVDEQYFLNVTPISFKSLTGAALMLRLKSMSNSGPLRNVGWNKMLIEVQHAGQKATPVYIRKTG